MTPTLHPPPPPGPRPGGGLPSGAPTPRGWWTPPETLVQRWPDSDLTVAYDTAHARTHLLDALAALVLERCRDGVADLSDLVRAFHDGPDDPEGDPEILLAVLTALEAAGLLVRRPPAR